MTCHVSVMFVIFKFVCLSVTFRSFGLLRRHDGRCRLTAGDSTITEVMSTAVFVGSSCCHHTGLRNCSLETVGIIMSQGTDGEKRL